MAAHLGDVKSKFCLIRIGWILEGVVNMPMLTRVQLCNDVLYLALQLGGVCPQGRREHVPHTLQYKHNQCSLPPSLSLPPSTFHHTRTRA